jgi:hypothetical protein
MPARKYDVVLSEEQRNHVEIIARSYKHSERERKRAKILLLSDINREDGGLLDAAICEQMKVCAVTVEQIRRRFAQKGLEAALYRREQQNRKARKLDGKAEAFLIATTCSAPPTGQKRWTLALLQKGLIEAGYTDSVSHETIRQTLKKTNSSPG